MNLEAGNYYHKKLLTLPDKALRSVTRPQIKDLGAIKTIHIVGVCGTAMGSLAGLLVEAGYKVSGSDVGCYPPMSDLIKELGITFHEGFDPVNLKDKDLIVIGNACGPTNPEAQVAREQGLLQMSLCEAIDAFCLREKKPLVVAGTHGKTTTTGLLAHVLLEAEIDPGFLVGGVMQKTGKSYSLGTGEYFVIEGDEYDTAYFDKAPKFLHYRPWGAIITSLEFDHVDIYHDMKDYTQAFQFLAEEVSPRGVLMLWGDDPKVKALSDTGGSQTLYYGLKKDNDVTAKNIKVMEEGQQFTLVVEGEELGEMMLPMSGTHNLLNALSVCGLCLFCGLNFETIKKALATFAGMKRRQEVVGEKGGITIIDDFAHHPTAVKETIKAIRQKYADRRIVAIFEPRSNTSRRKLFEKEYIKSFDDADFLCLKVPPLRHNDKEEDFLDARAVVKGVGRRGTKAHLFETTDALVEDILPSLKKGDVVLVMSNGSFDGVHQKLLKGL